MTWVGAFALFLVLAVLLLAAGRSLRSRRSLGRRERDDLHRSFLADSPEAIAVEADGRIAFANRAALRMFGYGAEQEVLGRSCPGFLAPEWHARAAEFRRACMAGDGGPESLEVVAVRLGGLPFDLEIQAAPVDWNGRPALQATLRDISARKRAEKRLDEATSLLEATLESTTDGIVVVSPEGRIVRVNRKLVRLWRIPPQVIALGNYSRLVDFIAESLREPESFRKEVDALDERPDAEKSGHFEFYDGRIFEWYSQPQRLGGQSVGRVWSFRDVTERKRAEDALRAALQRLEALLNNIPDIAWMKDRQGRFIAVNEPFLRAIGRSREQIIGQTDRDIFPAELAEKFQSEDRQVLLGGKHLEVTDRLTLADGRKVLIETIKSPIYGEGGQPTGTAGIARDVTERKQLEEQLLQSQKMEAIGRLAGGVAHDFNNLLTAISGYSDLLLRELPEESALRSHAEEIQKAGERAAALTQQLLAFSRRQVLEPRVVNLNAALANLEKMLRRLIGEDIELVTSAQPDLWPVKADPGQIEQVVLNLAVNARDAMPNGGRLTVSTQNTELDEEAARNSPPTRPGSYVLLAVADSGAGMSPETRSRLFEPFFTTKEVGKGTGLGLSTVYGIVKQSGGYIWVESEPGAGSVFKIFLPKSLETPEPVRVAVASGPAPSGSETILLVEDEPEVRALVQKFLLMHGYKVLPASSAEDAIELSGRYDGHIDLLLTDVVMPGETGRDLARRLLVARPRMRVLYMSGYTDDSVFLQGGLSRGEAYLQKPFTPEALAKKVREVLDIATERAATNP